MKKKNITPEEVFVPEVPVADDSDLDALLAEINDRINNSQVPVAQTPQDLADMLNGIEPVPHQEPRKTAAPEKKEPVRGMKPLVEPEQEEPKPRGKVFSFLNVLLMLLVLVLIAGIAFVFLNKGGVDPYKGRILENVMVGKVNVGGMTQEEAKQAISESFGTVYSDNDMHVILPGKELVLSAAETGAQMDLDGIVGAAYAVGRTGSTVERKQAYNASKEITTEIPFINYIGLNPYQIVGKIQEICGPAYGYYSPSGYRLEGDAPALDAEHFDESAPCQTLIISVGSLEYNPNLEAIYSAVIEGYKNQNFRIEIPGEWILKQPEPLDIQKIYDEVTVPAVESTVDPQTKAVTLGSCGYTFSMDDALNLLAAAEPGMMISLPMEYVVPENLDINPDFPVVLSSYTSTIFDDPDYRNNIVLMAESMNGDVIEAGQRYSALDQSLGINTYNGYLGAPIHGNSCTLKIVGGGTDQVGTTLHIAALTAGLNIVERHPGDHVCEYTCENGNDLRGTEVLLREYNDLKLLNPFDFPVCIEAKVSGNKLTVSVLGQQKAEGTYTIASVPLNESNFQTVIIDRETDSTVEYDHVYFEGIKGGTFNIRRDYTDADGNVTVGDQFNGGVFQTYLQPANMRVAK